jgi:short-subunit dehydrogenase
VARRVERLEELRDELTKRDPNLNVHLRAVDLSQTSEVDELCAWLLRENIAIDFLINNAGLGDRGAFATSEPQRVKEMLAVNMVALTVLTRALLPAMIEKKRGAILNVSSSAGFQPTSPVFPKASERNCAAAALP